MTKKTRATPKGSTHRFGGDWTDAKLDVLAKYLKSYTTALEGKPTPAQPFRKAYIDAFAGTGTRTARESESSGASETLPRLMRVTWRRGAAGHGGRVSLRRPGSVQ